MSGVDRWGIVMPFVVVQSEGGPYEDHAFVAGYECGLVDHMLAARPQVLDRTVHAPNLPQLDLIAMRHHFDFTVLSENEEWADVRFTHLTDDDDP